LAVVEAAAHKFLHDIVAKPCETISLQDGKHKIEFACYQFVVTCVVAAAVKVSKSEQPRTYERISLFCSKQMVDGLY
jgi:hypothetical protein